MSVDIDKLCADAEALNGKAKYTDKTAGEKECLDYNKLLKGGQTVQCAGFVYACITHQGAKFYNGSNTIWRKYLSDSGSVSDHKSSNGYPKNVNPLKSSQLEKGMVVFKWNSTDTDKYPDGKGDYQHIGIVTSVKPLHIMHSTSEQNRKGITMDTSIGKFCAWGKLSCIDYGNVDDESPSETIEQKQNGVDQTVESGTTGTLKIVAKSGLNLRKDSTTKSQKLDTIPKGTQLDFEAESSKWAMVTYKDQTGYIDIDSKDGFVQILSIDQDDGSVPTYTDADGDGVQDSELTTLIQRVAELEEAEGVTTSQIQGLYNFCKKIAQREGIALSVPGMGTYGGESDADN